ncbi:hypothetical protein J3D55_001342 [Chryseobacterium ginsenosidimutans]|uniref:DUF4270 domain-containing protein n=1 Tax=Chryseobacterium ginsenosidimutans TaxID=687846 RepID=UPI00216A531F|nr:DUF4270 domain-containing protein [Chryseobacterium ginsenosidimutans]MCS3868426.1 hypothetical protein [Chryseobacterium ginsenosidimutans]
MIHTIKKAITVLSLVIFGSALLYNCEPDADTLGEQLFLDGAAQGNEVSFDVTAYNINNNDSIRSDASKLTYGVLGAFDEDQFGMQKASYLTQLRLSTYDPDFGANAVVDSVVLVMKPTYASDSITTNTVDDNFTYTTDADGTVNAKKVVNTYPVLKFGKAKRTFHITVNEVNDFLKGPSDSVKSNQVFPPGAVLGSKEFKGSISSVAITKDDGGAALFTTTAPGIRIPLDKTFFQNKIIAKKDQPELQDASNFIRYFKGLKISVDESDGYLFQFSPNDMELIMYYKYDKTDVTPATKPQTTYTFALGSANTHIGQYQYARAGSALGSATIGDKTNGDKKLFTQGMGGPSIGIKIPQATIDELKKRYADNKAAIITAKIRIYTDPSWKNGYAKPTAFTFLQKYIDHKPNPAKTLMGFTADVLNLAGANGYTIYKSYDLDKDAAHYDFVVTQSIKKLIEPLTANSVYDDKKELLYFRIDMGSFQTNTDGTGLAGYKFTSTPYNTSRAVFVGTEAGNVNRVQLKVIYGTK